MKIAIYTSFAINYLAKARVFLRTVREQNPTIDVVAIICDRFPAWIDVAKEEFDQIWMVDDYPAAPVMGWIFRHNIMELSTAVKGWGLSRLLNAGYDYVMYIDPDCWILDDPAKIVALLPSDCSVGVVPHTTRPADSDEEIRIVETSSLRHGIYNLGFLLVRNDKNGRRLANWWETRLDKYCIDDFAEGLFTDQRWFDLALGYFDFIKVIRHRGIDVASWNVGQRPLTRDGPRYLIDGDRLIFYHFSGVGPSGVHRWVREKFAPSDPLAAELEFLYERRIASCGQTDLEKVVPFFDLYSDGIMVPPSHRAIYRRQLAFQERYTNPFDVNFSPNFREEACNADPTPQASAARLTGGDSEQLSRRLFDPVYFSTATGIFSGDDDSAWAEYKIRGWDQGVSGNRFFDTDFYRLFVSPEDQSSHPTPLHHYVARGIYVGTPPIWIYNDSYYLKKYPDVLDAIRTGSVVCGFQHFSKTGIEEGRDGCPFFNERAYLMRHPDVAAAVVDGRCRSGESHYIAFGWREGRPLR